MYQLWHYNRTGGIKRERERSGNFVPTKSPTSPSSYIMNVEERLPINVN